MAITPLMPVYPRCEVRPVKGEGVYLIGERGERYLDFASGIAVNLLGHGHPVLTKAIQDQAATLMRGPFTRGPLDALALEAVHPDHDVLFVGFRGEHMYLLPLEVKTGVRPNYDKAVEQARELKRYGDRLYGFGTIDPMSVIGVTITSSPGLTVAMKALNRICLPPVPTIVCSGL